MAVFIWWLHYCVTWQYNRWVWVIVEDQGSEVEGRKSRVRGRGSEVEVEGRKSRVACWGLRVKGRKSRVKSKGSKFRCLYVSNHSKEQSTFVGTCWLNTKAIVKRLSLATTSKKCDFPLNKNISFFRTIKKHTNLYILTLCFWLSTSTFSPSNYDPWRTYEYIRVHTSKTRVENYF